MRDNTNEHHEASLPLSLTIEHTRFRHRGVLVLGVDETGGSVGSRLLLRPVYDPEVIPSFSFFSQTLL